MAELLEVTLTALAYGGEALGRDNLGRVVFVPYTLPDEQVRVEIGEAHAHWARGRYTDLLAPSPERVPPRCRHYTVCGGCHYQHMNYPAQLRGKRTIVAAQLERLGGLASPPVEETVPSPSPWHTRNRLQFSVDDLGRLGFQAAGTNQIVPISECHLPEPALADLWPRLDIGPVPGLHRIEVRSGADGECLVIFEADHDPDVELDLEIPDSLVWVSDGQSTVLAGSGHLRMEVAGLSFRVSADSFFQVHTTLAAELTRRALALLNVRPGQTVFDLYAGVGLFSAFLAQAGARVVAVESSTAACADFEVNLHDFDSIDLYEASVEEAIPATGVHPDAVLVDPPRSGLGARVVDLLSAADIPRLVYISCDPATLARDARRLSAQGFRLESVTPIDLFPQTYHIETLSLWTR